MAIGLKGFQETIVAGMASLIRDASAKIDLRPDLRRTIANDLGLILLAAPTGSGKTLMTSTVLDRVSANDRCIWFWFSPFSALVDQTRLALLEDHAALTPRNLTTDRAFDQCRPGDVFLTTWSAVAVAARDARQARSRTDAMPGADELIEALRASGYKIGCVVDEAHHSFGLRTEAGRFYREVLKPDFTILATATPDDDGMERLRATLGHTRRPHRFMASRDQVVLARLNKAGLRACTFVVSKADERFVDMADAALLAGHRRHEQVKSDLALVGLSVVPLLLIQVDDNAGVEAARQTLARLGIAPSAIAVHTADEPDPDVIAMARGEDKEVLIFKVAVALGFDAPRAFTLVSMRTVRDADFGTQIVGRLMRVEPRLRAIPIEGPNVEALRRLDEAHVYLASAENQSGIVEAGERMRSLRGGVEAVASRIEIVEVSGGGRDIRLLDESGQVTLLPPAPDAPPSPRQVRAGAAVTTFPRSGLLPLSLPVSPTPARPLKASERAFTLSAPVLDVVSTAPPPGHLYRLRKDLAFPKSLRRERMPNDMADLLDGVAVAMKFDAEALGIFQRRTVNVAERDLDVFTHEVLRKTIETPVARRKVAERARQLMLFNEELDARELAQALLARLESVLRSRGIPVPGKDELRLGLEMILTRFPDALPSAQKQVLSTKVVVEQAAPLPEALPSPMRLDSAALNIYGVFPPLMNTWEREFAETLDNDTSGTVVWWHRNIDRKPESVAIVMETGQRYFPDFVVGVSARRRGEGVSLAETKYDFGSINSVMKNRTEHRDYGPPIMLYYDESNREFMVVEAVGNNFNQPIRSFEVEQLRHL